MALQCQGMGLSAKPGRAGTIIWALKPQVGLCQSCWTEAAIIGQAMIPFGRRPAIGPLTHDRYFAPCGPGLHPCKPKVVV